MSHFLSLVTISCCFFLLSCGTKKQEKEKEVPTKNTVIEASFNGKNQLNKEKQPIQVKFIEPEKAELTIKGETYTLKQYPTGSGYGYKNDIIDLRGKGYEAKLTFQNGEKWDLLDSSVSFRDTLTFPHFSFDVLVKNDTLTITPRGLELDNTPAQHNISGYSITKAEIGDLNTDSSPEVIICLKPLSGESYGQIIGYSVNNGKSMSQINWDPILNNSKVNKGYMGHDDFAIVENTFCQRFPLYEKEGNDIKLTKNRRQIQYKLIDGEACRQLVIDKVLEY